ncbi:bv/odv-e26 [Cyclophragma undans nucleopolyhedrovirus]|uniref:Bv/odv-e26 n=1 Tax=Cyclophragma undans nucleopolyhedrovirus TaxID=1906244 RepID=A0A288QD74_9ABAC|nr:bv/odv-e26 [Cyclophragma undans nucleopolyhedrovirus]AOT85593.1 bv/odv-e26 [Cyclophragma undans nucleopolyhedrovirus]
MNAPDRQRPLPRLSVADFASIRKRPFAVPSGCATRQHHTTTTTITTVSSSSSSSSSTTTSNTTKNIAHVISSLRNTHLNFNKIQAIQKKRLRHLQNLIRLKNETISQLVKRLESRTQFKTGNAKNNNYLGVVQCDAGSSSGGSIIRTVSGGEKFVRRRLAELCAATAPPHNAHYLFCGSRRNTEEDRRHMAKLLTAVYERSVIVYEKNRRFEFLKLDDAESAKRLLLKYLQDDNDESQGDFNAD